MYCGTLGPSEGDSDTTIRKKKSYAAQAWIRKIIKTAVFVGLIGFASFLIFTDAGRKLAQSVAKSLKLPGSTPEYSQAVQLIRDQVPGIRKLEKGSVTSLRYEQEDLGEGDIRVTVFKQDGGDFLQATFVVDIYYESVYAMDAAALNLMNDE